MDKIGDGRKMCSFCGEDIASDFKRCPYCGSLLQLDVGHLDTDSHNTVDGVNENIEANSADSSYRFEKSINDTNSVTDFTGKAIFKEQDLNSDDEDFALKDALASRKSFENNPAGAIKNDDAGRTNRYDNKNKQLNKQKQTNKQKKPLGNGRKVFIVTLSNLVPGIGQLFGAISAIAFMNTEGDKDRKSFGSALLVSSVIAFVVSISALAFLTLCFA